MTLEKAKTYTLIAAVLFGIQFFVLLIVGVLIFFFLWPFVISLMPPSVDPSILALLSWLQWFIPILLIIQSIVSLIFFSLTMQWRHDPFSHKTGLLVVGVIGIIGTGLLPGIFALIASMAKE